MKLIKIYVSSFGKIKDFEFDLVDGVNTLKEENGWGKSTLAYFVKCIFYGIKDGKHSIEENERLKFKPWNSTEKFGGYIVFDWLGKRFKVERFFGNKKSEDSVRIFDADTGKEFFDTASLGERIFKIDEEGFISTVFFSQKDLEVKSNTSLTAKYNTACEVAETEAFDNAVAMIDGKYKKYRYSGNRGYIPDAQNELFVLNQKIDRASSAFDAVKQLKEQSEIVSNEIEELKKQIKILTDKTTDAGKAEAVKIKKANYEKKISEIKSLESVIRENRKALNETNPFKEQVRGLEDCIFEYEKCIERKNSVITDVEGLKRKKQEEEFQVKNRKSAFLIPFIFCFVLLVTGIVLSFFVLPIGIAISVLAVVAAVTFCVLNNKSKSKKSVSVYAPMIEAKNNEILQLGEMENKYRESIEDFLSVFNVQGTYREKVYILKSLLLSKEENENKLVSLRKELSEMDKDPDLRLNFENVESLSSLQQKLHFIQEQISEKNKQFANLTGRITACESEANSLADLESEKSEKELKISELNNESEILGLTLKFLKEANENLKSKYKQPLEISLNKYFSYITGKDNAKIDVDFKVSLDEKGVERASEYYSKGYKNLFDICKRFALVDVLFSSEKPIIILDDPFCNLDEEKLNASLDLIENFGKEYQILYLVCHESRVKNG